jgi:hypothetical protein
MMLDGHSATSVAQRQRLHGILFWNLQAGDGNDRV